MKTALSICYVIEQKTSLESFENVVLLVKNVKQFITEDILFKALTDIKLTKVQYVKIKKQVESQADQLERLT